MAKQRKREIRALDFEVSRVLVTIDEMLGCVFDDWRPIGQAFQLDVSIREGTALGDATKLFVAVDILNWSSTSGPCLVCSVARDGDDGWLCEEGILSATHVEGLRAGSGVFHFHHGYPSCLTFPDCSDTQVRDILREAIRLRRPDLIGQEEVSL